jgi:KEOPS complex subunit Cgi121
VELVEGRARVEDVDVYVERLDEIGVAHDCAVQSFDARYVAGRAHLERAVALAERAIERGEAVARERPVEILLYAAGRRQIDRALAMGVDAGETPVVVLVASDFPDAPVDERDAEADCATAVADRLDATDSLDAGEPFGATDSLDAGEPFGATDRERVREFFDVGDRELAATDASLADLVRERVVLLSIDH